MCAGPSFALLRKEAFITNREVTLDQDVAQAMLSMRLRPVPAKQIAVESSPKRELRKAKEGESALTQAFIGIRYPA